MGLYKVYDKFRRYWRQIHMLTIRDGWKKIFNIAKREVELDRFGKEIKIHYLKGNAVKTIASLLDGNIIEPLVENVERIMKYRTK